MTNVTGYLRYPHIVADQIVFTAEDDVWLAPSQGGRAWRLTADGVVVARPRLSPDGSQVAWVSTRNGTHEVFVMPTTGGSPRQLTFFGSATTTVHGFGPDGRLIVLSAGSQPFLQHVWAYAIDITEGADATPQRLPYGAVNAVADSGTGPVVVGTGNMRDYAHWKRYRGGTAGRLWLADAPDSDFCEILSDVVGPKSNPVWTSGRLAFLADFEGHGNVYSMAADGTDLRRHTDHERFYARHLSGDGHALSYAHAGQLWTLDSVAADSEPRQLEISLASPRNGRATRSLDAAEHLTGVSVDHTGRASAIEARGTVSWLTHRDGPARVLAAEPGVRHRMPVVLNPAGDGATPSVAYVTDADGDDAIEVATVDGNVRRLAGGSLGRVLELAASPDAGTLAVATHDGRLLTVTVADGAITDLESSDVGEPTGLAFSPDSKWLAYSAAEPAQLRSIRIAELSTGTVTAVTTRRFIDSDPRFSADGKYLFFLSARTFDPVYDAHVFDLAFPLATRPYLVTLAADTPSPFEPELAGRSADAGKDDTADVGSGSGKHSDDGDSQAVTTRVDPEHLAERVVAFPVAAGRLGDLQAVADGAIWTDSPIAGELGESRNSDDDVRPSVQRWDFGKRKQIQLADAVDGIAASGDGRKLVIRDAGALKVVPADHKPSEDGDDVIEVDLTRLGLSIEPPAEWRQMLDETARLMAQFYWSEDMSDVDWDAEVDKYRPLIDQLASRDDLSDVLWEVNGETGSSHAYETPPPSKPNPLLAAAFLGADLSRDADGRWRIDRVVPGDNSARDARSPLTEPGVQVQAGDLVLAVNGRAVGSNGPAELLRGTADKPVELTVSRAGEQRSVVVTPLAGDTQLRYLDWVAARRAIVHAATEGRVGYVHIPDMMSNGWAAFHRNLRVEMARDALIVDTRNNGGGHTSQLVLEKLTRKVLGHDSVRHGQDEAWPDGAPMGPLVSIANEWAGSDGDI
ncbi:MAG TPA: PDZ domain-containing protein, partial [Jatrophihabitans sp.]